MLLRWSDEDRERAQAFKHSGPWRMLRIFGAFVDVCDTVSGTDLAVSVFGSARVGEDDPISMPEREEGMGRVEAGLSAIVEGGPGAMAPRTAVRVKPAAHWSALRAVVGIGH